MGLVTQTIKEPGTNELTRTTFPLTEGILYSAAFHGGSSLFARYLNWVEFGLLPDGSDIKGVGTVLASGRIANIGSLGWTGRHPISTDDLIYIDTWGQWTVRPKISFYILKPDPNLSSMQVLDA